MLILDTSGILAALSKRDPHHAQALASMRADPGPFMVVAGIMAEIAYMIEVRLGAHVLDEFLADLEDGAFMLDCAEGDLPRVRVLVTRYRDLSLGYADAAVIAAGERSGGAVLSYDVRHLRTVSREGTFRLAGD